MREIKFRVWHKIWKRMYEMDCTHYIDAPEYGDPIAWGNPDFEFMQFTGLKDKNGKDIYEGDILRQWGELWEVTGLDRGSFGIDVHKELKNGGTVIDSHYVISAVLPKACEVIGNIYENPELLEAA